MTLIGAVWRVPESCPTAQVKTMKDEKQELLRVVEELRAENGNLQVHRTASTARHGCLQGWRTVVWLCSRHQCSWGALSACLSKPVAGHALVHFFG
jgi:hypothetical protein